MQLGLSTKSLEGVSIFSDSFTTPSDEAILEYLNKIRYEVVLKSLNDIIKVLKREELLTEKNINLLDLYNLNIRSKMI